MSKTLTIKLPELYPYQKEFCEDMTKISICLSSTKCGKSVSNLIYMLEQALISKPYSNLCWGSPSYSQSKLSMDRLIVMLSTSDRHQRLFVVNLSQMFIKFKHNNSSIWFKSVSNVPSLYGFDYTYIVLDEFSRCPLEAFEVLLTNAAPHKARIKLIGNVVNKNHWSWGIYVKAVAGLEGYSHYRWDCYKALEYGLLDLETINHAKAMLTEEKFATDWLAIPSDSQAIMFNSKYVNQCIHPLSTKPAVAYGIDIASKVDWTVIIGVDVDNNVCHLDRFQEEWEYTHKKILALPKGIPTLLDETGVGGAVVERLKRESGDIYGFTFTNKSKNSIIMRLQKDIETLSVGFPLGIISTEMTTFEYKYTSSNNITYNATGGNTDDAICALALALECRAKFLNTFIF